MAGEPPHQQIPKWKFNRIEKKQQTKRERECRDGGGGPQSASAAEIPTVRGLPQKGQTSDQGSQLEAILAREKRQVPGTVTPTLALGHTDEALTQKNTIWKELIHLGSLT